jgi:predicted transcriptional regulator
VATYSVSSGDSFCPIMIKELVNIAQTWNRGGGQAKRPQQAEEMLQLRNRGWTVYAIAQEMGVSEGTVKNRIKEALDRREFPHTDEYRNRQNDHLDDLVRRHEQTIEAMEVIITNPDVKPEAIIEAVRERRHCLEALLRIADRRARLLGIDAPIKVEQTVAEVEPGGP